MKDIIWLLWTGKILNTCYGNCLKKNLVRISGEVKVIPASSDGGVDAVAFDRDPTRGGKNCNSS